MVGRINIIMVIELLVLREKQIGMRSGSTKKIVAQVQSDCRLDQQTISITVNPVEQQRSTARL